MADLNSKDKTQIQGPYRDFCAQVDNRRRGIEPRVLVADLGIVIGAEVTTLMKDLTNVRRALASDERREELASVVKEARDLQVVSRLEDLHQLRHRHVEVVKFEVLELERLDFLPPWVLYD